MQSNVNIGPYSEESSVDVKGKKIVIENSNELNIPKVGQSSHEHKVEYGLFSKEEYKSDELKIGGIFKSSETHHTENTLTRDTEEHTNYLKIGSIFESEERTYENSGQGGNVEGREVETSCCGLTAKSSEESSCCTSDALCGYKCSMNWCGEECSLNINTVCCFRPICNLIENANCPSIPSISCSSLPNLNEIGECLEPAVGACRGVINSIDCNQVAGCLREAWPVIRDIGECVLDLISSRN